MKRVLVGLLCAAVAAAWLALVLWLWVLFIKWAVTL